MNKHATHRVALAPVLAVLLALATTAQATLIPAPEVGDTFASALNVDILFSLDFDADIFDSTTVAHASVQASIDSQSDVDWYSFTVLSGGALYLDIDSTTSNLDTVIHLFDQNGTLLALSDDTFPADPGSGGANLDPFLGVYAPTVTPGVFYAAVSIFDNFADALDSCDSFIALTRPDGIVSDGSACVNATTGLNTFSGTGSGFTGDYVLHMSNTQPIPAPTTLSLLALGLAGMVLGWRGARGSG